MSCRSAVRADALLATPGVAQVVDFGKCDRPLGEDGDGAVLKVETRFLKNPSSYDISGLRFDSDNQTIINERIYLDKTDANTLYDQITVFDHSLTRPCSKTQKAIRTSNPRPMWFANVCAEDNIHVSIEHEQYYRSADGKLMWTKKTGRSRI